MRLVLAFIASIGFVQLFAQQAQDRWWPTQRMPKGLVEVRNEAAGSRRAMEMMVQSIAGLAAKAVNEGRGDEMVWVDTGNASLDEWCARWRAAHPTVTVTGPMNSWDLIDRFAKRGHIKGYILYKPDNSKRDLNSYSAGMDCSVNVATSLAPILDAIIIDESLETQAVAHGLKRLLDA